MPFTLDDPIAYTFVFVEGKKEAPPVAETYRNTLLNAPQLMRSPPSKDLFFGNDAFEKWAQMLEEDFYHIPREEFEALNSIAHWHYYCIYMCMVSTNIFSKRHTTDRALQMNPELASIAPALEREYKALKVLEQKLEKAKGGFSVTYDVLQDAKQCKKIAGILRQFPEVYTRICAIIESIEAAA